MLDLTGHTMAELLQSMLLRVTEQVNKRDGSLIRTALSAAAWVIEGLYIDLIDVQKNCYGTTATGDYLDYKAEERGVYRLAATSASYYMIANISTIPIGNQLADSQNRTWNVAQYVGPDGDNFKYIIVNADAGNVTEANGVLRPLSFVQGLTNAVFGDEITSGSDIEDDASLRKRYLESLVEISFAGNIASYRETMLAMKYSVGGYDAVIGAMQVYPITNAAGQKQEGHVKIWILDDDMKQASQPLVDAVQDAVCPMYNGVATNTGYGIAPICACVHIATVTSHPKLSIIIRVQISGGYSLDAVSAQIKENVNKYIQEQKKTWAEQLPFGSNVVHIFIRESFIMAAALVPGVVDVPFITIAKDGTIHNNYAIWYTAGPIFVWIDDDTTTITVVSV